MKTLLALIATLVVLSGAAFAQPAVTQVSNAASYALPPLQNSPIAQGSFFAVFGSNLGPSTFAYWGTYPLPTDLEGTSISVTVGGTTTDAIIEFVSTGQVNAVLPSNTPTGDGTLTVTVNGTASAPFDITVIDSSFGAFAWNAAGTGPGIVQDTSYVLLTPYHTTKPGDYVTLWGTGLGPVDAATEATAPPTITNLCSSPSSCPVTVWVAGQQASIYYAGRSGYTAVDQIVFQIPQGVQGCYVQVAVQTGPVVSNFTSISVDPNGATCQDADGINYSDLPSTGANVLAVSLLSNYLDLNINLLGNLPWDNDTVSGQIGTFSPYVLSAFQGFALAPSVGNCTVLPFLQYPPPSDPAAGYATFLDAGGSFTVSGPNGAATIVKSTNTSGNPVGYRGQEGTDPVVGGETVQELIAGCPASRTDNCVPFFLSPTFAISSGTYTINGSGGPDVGAFSGSVTVSPSTASFQWTNQASITGANIPRNAPLTITWSGGDPNGFVDITAVSSTLLSGASPAADTPGILVECMAPASAGQFTIPTYVLQSLPSTATSTALVPPGELLVGPASAPVKMTTSSGLDAAYVFYHFIQGQNVTWQ